MVLLGSPLGPQANDVLLIITKIQAGIQYEFPSHRFNIIGGYIVNNLSDEYSISPNLKW